MKKIIEIPLIVDLRDWHALSEKLSSQEIMKRLNVALQNELKKMTDENIYFNPNDKSEQ